MDIYNASRRNEEWGLLCYLKNILPEMEDFNPE